MKLTPLLDGLGFGEGPRWRDGRLWYTDHRFKHVRTIDEAGKVETIVDVPGQPSGLGWRPDGTMLIVSMTDRRLMRFADGRLTVEAELSGLAPHNCNDMIVDPHGRAYVGNFGFDLEAKATPCTTCLIRVDPDGSVHKAADGLMFPNGTVITPDGRTMIVAETFGNRLSAYDLAADGTLSNRRTWAAVDRWGRLDFLDNNIGIGSRGSVVDEKPEEYRRVMQVNVETMFLLSKHAIPAMIKTAKGGAIVNISSISALRPRGLTTYTTSKAAVIGLTQAMAVDHGRDHIRVNCICPGPMYTPMVNRGNGMTEAARAARANASVLKIEGTGWDIGHGVRFLMSNHARYITGQVLVIDGGVTLQGPERDSGAQ